MGRGVALGVLLQAGRAGAVASAVVGSATAAHLSADGRLPGPTTMVIVILACVAALAPALRLPASPRRLVVLLVVGQTLVHLLLTALAGHGAHHTGHATGSGVAMAAGSPSSGTATYPDGTLGAALGMDRLMADAPPGWDRTPEWLARLQHDLTPAHAPMALAHVAAGVAIGVLLAAADRRLWRAPALLAGCVSAVTAAVRRAAATLCSGWRTSGDVPGRVAPPPPPAPWVAPLQRRHTGLTGGLVRRGPPQPPGCPTTWGATVAS